MDGLINKPVETVEKPTTFEQKKYELYRNSSESGENVTKEQPKKHEWYCQCKNCVTPGSNKIG